MHCSKDPAALEVICIQTQFWSSVHKELSYFPRSSTRSPEKLREIQYREDHKRVLSIPECLIMLLIVLCGR